MANPWDLLLNPRPLDELAPATESTNADAESNDPSAANPQADPYPEPPPEPTAFSEATPNRTQRTLAESTGIRTFGPAAEAGASAAEGYRAGENAFEDTTGQGRPQQFGTEEPMRPGEGPLSPAATAEKFVERYGVPRRDPNNRALNGEQLLEKRQGYEARAAEDRKAAMTERLQKKELADVNRASAREKDADMWTQMHAINGLQRGGGGGPVGGPQVANIGGATYVGPGFGRSAGFGPHGATDPAKFALEQQRLLQGDRRLEQGDARLKQLKELGYSDADIKKMRLALGEKAEANKQGRAEAALANKTNQEGQTSGAMIAELAAQIKKREAYADQNAPGFLGRTWDATWGAKPQDLRDVTWDERLKKPSKIVPGEYNRTVDQLRNEAASLKRMDPKLANQIIDGMSEETAALLHRILNDQKQ